MNERLPDNFGTKRLVAQGPGWRIADERCRAGPKDAPFEEEHSRFSIAAVLAGTFAYRSVKGRVLMVPGSFLLGQQGTCFCCSHEHGTGDRCVAFYFEPSMIEELAYDIPALRRAGPGVTRIPPLQSLTPLLADVSVIADSGGTAFGEELVMRVAGAILRLTDGCHDVKVRDRDERRASEALRIIHERLADPLSLATLAEEVGMSRYHFLRTFYRTTGETPYRYIVNRRLILAAQLLSTTPKGVLDVALDCGFSDLSEFIHHFRRRFRTTPAAYRRARQAFE